MNIIITGGAGFIGCNAAKSFMDRGHRVFIFDDLSRGGSELNLKWLRSQGEFVFVKGDVRDYAQVVDLFRRSGKTDVVLHLAAQVAVTLSVSDPRKDFQVNALGSFNVCEAVRTEAPEAILLNASTNKVYGDMEDEDVALKGSRYAYRDLPSGVSEGYPVDFHSPYGCSKGAADQYVKDYSRIYGIRSVNFRQSCIYGYRQMGMEDQGWVMWFVLCALMDRTISIYGDGKQVRDVLFIDDLIECYYGAIDEINITRGRSYNIGGGAGNSVSLLEVIEMIRSLTGKDVKIKYCDWRPGDQKIFVCDILKAKKELSWEPGTGVEDGLKKTLAWAEDNLDMFKKLYG